MKNLLKNRVALVTGASRGIGKDSAIRLAGAGAKVIVNYYKSKPEADEVVEVIKANGGQAIAIKADVSKEPEIKRLFNETVATFGHVEILVNNAGINPGRPILELTLQDFMDCINVNLASAFLTTQAALPYMIEKNFGRIINISSIAAQLGGVIGPHYAASKAGMLGLTHSYAAILSKYGGITSNAIAPALIETDMVTKNPNAKASLIPLGRFGQSDEVSDIVLLLASNGYITGQTINVNGGWYMS
jgi:3-oxoacyl-[acyl-carrier protein] reductase